MKLWVEKVDKYPLFNGLKSAREFVGWETFHRRNIGGIGDIKQHDLLGFGVRTRLAIAFNRTLIDPKNYVKRLSNTLESHRERWNSNKYYAPYIDLLQSSGAGKSRVVNELSTIHFSFKV
jgi:hypothetical protein